MTVQTVRIIDLLIQKLAPDIGDAGDLRANLRRIVRAVHEALAPDLCAILAINPITEEFMPPLEFAGELRQADQRIEAAPRAAGITQQILRERLVFVEDIAAYPQFQSSFMASEGIQAFAAVALFTQPQHKQLAILYLDYRKPQRFSKDERSLIQLLADQITVTLQQTWLLHRYSQVIQISQELNEDIRTAEILFQKLHGQISGILDVQHFFMLAVYRLQSNTLDYYLAGAEGFEQHLGRPFTGACSWVIQEQKSLLITERSQQAADYGFQFATVHGTPIEEESLLFVPLVLRGISLGVLTLQSVQPYTYDHEDQRVLELLGNHVALALSNIRLFAGLGQINQAGQLVTQQIDSAQVLGSVVEQIYATTQAAQVVFYPHRPSEKRFERALASGALVRISPHYDQIVQLAVDQPHPLFVRDLAKPSQPLGAAGEALLRDEAVAALVAIPLVVSSELLGVLLIGYEQPQRFDAPQRLVIESLASYAAIAVAANRGGIAETRRRYVAELEILQQIDRALAQALTLPETLQTILRLAMEHIRTSKASIFLYDPRAEVLEAAASFSVESPEHQPDVAIPITERRGLVWLAFEQKAPVRADNVADPKWRNLYIRRNPTTVSELDVPLLNDGEVVGVINFESAEENAFSQGDQEFLLVLAGQAVLAVKNAQAYQRAADERQALIEINDEIAGQLDRQRVLDLILEQALTLTKSDAGTLMLYDAQTELLWMAAERGVSSERKNQPHRLDQGVVGHVARTRETVIIGDLTRPPWSSIHLPYIPGVLSEMAVPLLEGDLLRGVINIESTEDYHFNERDERLVKTLAGMAVIALQNVERYERAEASRRRLLILHEIAQQIISQLGDPGQVIQLILQNALRLTDADIADLDLYESDTLSIVYSTRAQDQWTRESGRPDPRRGVMAHVATTRRPYRTSGDAQHDPYFVGDTDIHSEIAVPLLSERGVLVGMLNVESRKAHAFDEDDETMLGLFAGQALIAIQNARSYTQAGRERERFRLLYQAGAELGELSSLDQLPEAYALILQIVSAQSQARAIIRRYDLATRALYPVDAEDHPPGPIPTLKLGEGLGGSVAITRQTLVVNDLRTLPPESVVSPSTLGLSLVIIPIKVHVQGEEDYYGNLTLTHDTANHFLDVEVELYEGLATQLALTIYRLETSSAQQAMTQRIREAEAMSAIGEVAFELAHRVGNDLGLIPTTVKQINRELAVLKVDSPVIAHKLEQIVQDVRKVLELSRELRSEMGGLRDNKDQATHSLLVRELLDQTSRAYPALPETIRVLIESIEDDLHVHGRYQQLTNILRNLFVNAVEAMAEGGVITLRAQARGRSVTIQVEDSGPGIPAEQQSDIFNLFYSTKGSSGFGLWSARRNVLANGGELTVESWPGRTTFTLVLPRGHDP